MHKELVHSEIVSTFRNINYAVVNPLLLSPSEDRGFTILLNAFAEYKISAEMKMLYRLKRRHKDVIPFEA
jgi:hypothetical protein